MKKETSNDKMLKRVRLKIFAWYGIVVLGIATIVLSLFSLFTGLNPIFPLLCFLVEAFFSRWYSKLK